MTNQDKDKKPFQLYFLDVETVSEDFKGIGFSSTFPHLIIHKNNEPIQTLDVEYEDIKQLASSEFHFDELLNHLIDISNLAPFSGDAPNHRDCICETWQEFISKVDMFMTTESMEARQGTKLVGDEINISNAIEKKLGHLMGKDPILKDIVAAAAIFASNSPDMECSKRILALATALVDPVANYSTEKTHQVKNLVNEADGTLVTELSSASFGTEIYKYETMDSRLAGLGRLMKYIEGLDDGVSRTLVFGEAVSGKLDYVEIAAEWDGNKWESDEYSLGTQAPSAKP